ncbi:unnamed protein product [Lasius platythorax]|uniref:C2H2-type domain-containing protein n=1 Tax=Lasius platythorax TaxID=488582 RepID=A0AAV2NJP7_9HYME
MDYCVAVTRHHVPQSYPSTMTITTTTASVTTRTNASAKKFPCANCSSAFSRKGGLTYHQKFECGQEPRFKCPYCVYRGSHSSNTRRHVRKCHPGQNVYFVDLCKQETTAARALLRPEMLKKDDIVSPSEERRTAKTEEKEADSAL